MYFVGLPAVMVTFGEQREQPGNALKARLWILGEAADPEMGHSRGFRRSESSD